MPGSSAGSATYLVLYAWRWARATTHYCWSYQHADTRRQEPPTGQPRPHYPDGRHQRPPDRWDSLRQDSVVLRAKTGMGQHCCDSQAPATQYYTTWRGVAALVRQNPASDATSTLKVVRQFLLRKNDDGRAGRSRPWTPEPTPSRPVASPYSWRHPDGHRLGRRAADRRSRAHDPCGKPLNGDGMVSGTWAADCQSKTARRGYAQVLHLHPGTGIGGDHRPGIHRGYLPVPEVWGCQERNCSLRERRRVV